MSTTKSRKAKGRRLQDTVREWLMNILGVDKSDVHVALMGEKGVDVALGNLVFECTNSEKVNIWRKVAQCEHNAEQYRKANKMDKVLSFTVIKKNHTDPYVVMPASTFRAMFYATCVGAATSATIVGLEDDQKLDSFLKEAEPFQC